MFLFTGWFDKSNGFTLMAEIFVCRTFETKIIAKFSIFFGMAISSAYFAEKAFMNGKLSKFWRQKTL